MEIELLQGEGGYAGAIGGGLQAGIGGLTRRYVGMGHRYLLNRICNQNSQLWGDNL